jgi:hypothetical protein
VEIRTPVSSLVAFAASASGPGTSEVSPDYLDAAPRQEVESMEIEFFWTLESGRDETRRELPQVLDFVLNRLDFGALRRDLGLDQEAGATSPRPARGRSMEHEFRVATGSRGTKDP